MENQAIAPLTADELRQASFEADKRMRELYAEQWSLRPLFADPRRAKYVTLLMMGSVGGKQISKREAAKIAGFAAPPPDNIRWMRVVNTVMVEKLKQVGADMDFVAGKIKSLMETPDVRLTRTGDIVHMGRDDPNALANGIKLWMALMHGSQQEAKDAIAKGQEDGDDEDIAIEFS